jgi:hypothetical protein
MPQACNLFLNDVLLSGCLGAYLNDKNMLPLLIYALTVPCLSSPQGTSSTLSYDPDLANLMSKTNLLVVEGYLFELPHTIEAIKKTCEDAHKNGALIAVTASDVSCIKRCYNDFW